MPSEFYDSSRYIPNKSINAKLFTCSFIIFSILKQNGVVLNLVSWVRPSTRWTKPIINVQEVDGNHVNEKPLGTSSDLKF